MTDRTVDSLTAATALDDADVMLINQGGIAKKAPGSLVLRAANNLSDVASASTARTNLGITPFYTSVSSFTFAGAATTRCTNLTQCFVATEAMPTLVDGTAYRIVLDFNSANTNDICILLDNGTSGYMVAMERTSQFVRVYKCLAGTNTILATGAPVTVLYTAGKGRLILNFTVGGATGNQITGGWPNCGSGGFEATLNMTSGTWVLSFRGAATSEVVAMKLYTAPLW